MKYCPISKKLIQELAMATSDGYHQEIVLLAKKEKSSCITKSYPLCYASSCALIPAIASNVLSGAYIKAAQEGYIIVGFGVICSSSLTEVLIAQHGGWQADLKNDDTLIDHGGLLAHGMAFMAIHKDGNCYWYAQDKLMGFSRLAPQPVEIIKD